MTWRTVFKFCTSWSGILISKWSSMFIISSDNSKESQPRSLMKWDSGDISISSMPTTSDMIFLSWFKLVDVSMVVSG